jgi:hypothetical protein
MSPIGTKRTQLDVQRESAMRSRADIELDHAGIVVRLLRLDQEILSGRADEPQTVARRGWAASTGKSPNRLSSPARKNIPVHFRPKSPLHPPYPALTRGGVSRSSRTLRRDAMDVNGATDESADSRTAKSCGPDTPTLVSSSREASFLGMTVANKPGHRGEREVDR